MLCEGGLESDPEILRLKSYRKPFLIWSFGNWNALRSTILHVIDFDSNLLGVRSSRTEGELQRELVNCHVIMNRSPSEGDTNFPSSRSSRVIPEHAK